MKSLIEFLKLLFKFRTKELFVTPTNNGFTQFFRFVFVGGIATVVDLLTATLAYEVFGLQTANLHWIGFDIGALLANALGFLVGLTVNYILSVIFVFRYQNINRVKEFLSFTVIGIIGLGIKLITVALLERFALNLNEKVFGLIPMVTVVAAIGTIVAFIWNFIARKFGLYSKKNQERLQK
ncbi:MAG: GtrA family protein [Clostridia bacterium]|nr:GtrA family protein [Clostridia bacterium]